ncbi:MAG: enoyl-CoA hydratase-related protein [Candidatus Marinimicrobia bacterium]|nr:enoyl-CoA hydratase-related protein [Candidatus Neomarinimicrobiota bacterium]
MSYIKINNDNLISEIIIDRPEALNAMNSDVLLELTDAMKKVKSDDKTGVVIITGAGDKAFIAGADIKAMQQMNDKEAFDYGKAGQQLTMMIETSSKPVIAAVNGFALGGGCELALACHMRIVSENGSFGQPEVKLGILPGWGGTQRLPKIVGVGKAIELITTGTIINAEESYRIGLANKICPQNQLMSESRKLASSILKNGPRAISSSLRCIYGGLTMSIKEGMDIEVEEFGELFRHDERMEGLTAFIEKRDPEFRH